MIVLDASVVVELLTNGPLAESPRLDLAGRSDSFLAPHLLDVEVMSAIRKLAAGRRVGSRCSHADRREAYIDSGYPGCDGGAREEDSISRD